MRVISIAVLIGLLAGCGKAVMLQTPYPWPKYGPSNRSEIGVVSYDITHRSPAHNDSGRFSAYKLMRNACKGPYEMSGPYQQNEPYNSIVQNAEAPIRTTMVIEFWCVPAASVDSYRAAGSLPAYGYNRTNTWDHDFTLDYNHSIRIRVPR